MGIRDKIIIRHKDYRIIYSHQCDAKHFTNLAKQKTCTLRDLKQYCTDTGYEFPIPDYIFYNYYNPDEEVIIEIKRYK